MKTERLPEDEPQTAKTPRAWLVRVGAASDPMASPTMFDLEGRARLSLGRTDPDIPDADDTVTCDDRWMSRAHALIDRRTEGWTVADQGSANGTIVNGHRVSFGALHDGDVIQTGSTFWVFRSDVIEGPLPSEVRQDTFGSVSTRFIEVVSLAERIAPSRVPVLIVGDTGTGKELLARHIHACSGRDGPFAAINTAAVQSNLVASELFGVERGAHSMAERTRPGQIRSANRGTLLLDEVGDMPLEVQVTLLRVLQENEVLPVGGDRPITIDVRFVCATHQNIPDLVTLGRFRADLQARLQGTVLYLPTLSDRREDIGLLIGRFLRAFDATTFTLTPAAYRALMIHDWPRNIRQLERAIQTAVAVSRSGQIELSDLPEEVRVTKPPSARPNFEDEERHRELIRLLTAHRGNVSAVARSMGYSRMQVHRWLKQYNIKPEDYRRADG